MLIIPSSSPLYMLLTSDAPGLAGSKLEVGGKAGFACGCPRATVRMPWGGLGRCPEKMKLQWSLG